MTWTRLTDNWCDDKVLRRLDLAARWHYLCMIQWCSRNEDYDGLIRLCDAERASDVNDRTKAIGDLIAAGLVKNVDGETLKVVNIKDHVPPASVRQKSADRTRRWRKHKDGDHSECLAGNCDALSDASRDQSPQDRTGQDGKKTPDTTDDVEQGLLPDDPDLTAHLDQAS